MFPLSQSIRPLMVLWLFSALCCATPAIACTVTQSVTTTLGTYSPAAVKAGAVPALQSKAGIQCDVAILVLLSNTYLRATFNSSNGLKLIQQGGSNAVPYVASADAAGATPFTSGGTVDYFQNNLLNLLGLLGSSSADMPFYAKPNGGTLVPTGSYTDRVTINWAWNQCMGIAALGACVGTVDTGVGTSVIDIAMIVSPQNVIMTTSAVTTWDPVNSTNRPRDLPGSRRRSSIAVANPDIVPLDSGSLALIVATPTGSVIALDGDGTFGGAAIRLTDGTPASGLTLNYTNPSDQGDNVDFSSDGGGSWTYAPVAGSIASERGITHVRIRPQGAMAKQSAFSVSLPFLLQ